MTPHITPHPQVRESERQRERTGELDLDSNTTPHPQVRESERQRERTGELDLDSNSLLREKEDQIKRLEKWLESYKAKIEVGIVRFWGVFSRGLVTFCGNFMNDDCNYGM